MFWCEYMEIKVVHFPQNIHFFIYKRSCNIGEKGRKLTIKQLSFLILKAW